MRAPAAAIGLILAAASAQAASLLSYPMNWGQATVHDEGRTFKLWVHPKENRILLEASLGEAMLNNPSKWPIEYWRHAAETFVTPAGCGIEDVAAHWRAGGAWEATYVCPPGVDLRALVNAQSAALKKGLPLQPADLVGR